MDLWIRSQDKEVLSKVNNLCYYTRKDVCEFIMEHDLAEDIQHVVWSPDGSILGYYKTKERALEVLDEIQEFIENRNKVKITQDINGITSEVEDAKRVYEMPKE